MDLTSWGEMMDDLRLQLDWAAGVAASEGDEPATRKQCHMLAALLPPTMRTWNDGPLTKRGASARIEALLSPLDPPPRRRGPPRRRRTPAREQNAQLAAERLALAQNLPDGAICVCVAADDRNMPAAEHLVVRDGTELWRALSSVPVRSPRSVHVLTVRDGTLDYRPVCAGGGVRVVLRGLMPQSVAQIVWDDIQRTLEFDAKIAGLADAARAAVLSHPPPRLVTQEDAP